MIWPTVFLLITGNYGELTLECILVDTTSWLVEVACWRILNVFDKLEISIDISLIHTGIVNTCVIFLLLYEMKHKLAAQTLTD
jgi:hypothetical protein